MNAEETNKTIMNSLAHENRMILDELILRQDSIEKARNRMFEKRFEMIVRAVRTDIKNSIKSNLKNFTPKKNTALVSNDVKIDPEKIKQRRDFKELSIKKLNQDHIVGANSGYYVIANVYKNKKYLNAFVKDLKEKGLAPKQFYNKENGLHYVYLANYNYKVEAKDAYVSNLNGRYQDEKWIMEVTNNSTIVHNSYQD